MEIGSKLRQARLDAGLSQRQLCGEMITRNMLSLIENGSARPSMDTLAYLAERLGRPISFFLEEESGNAYVMKQAREAYVQGQYTEVEALLKQYKPDGVQDEEWALLGTLTLLAMAEQALDRPAYARELLERAAQQRSCYLIPELEQRRLLLLSEVSLEAVELPVDDRPLLCRAKAALENQDANRCLVLLEACEEQENPRWRYLRAETAFALGDYATAAAHYPPDSYARLEECYRNLGDYKKAYEYACKQR